jgi:hypothetical protein
MGKSKREKREVSTARPRRRGAPWMSPTRELLAAAESLALQIYPWWRLELEVETTDAIFSVPSTVEARLPRAIWWSVHQLYGYDDGRAFNIIFPYASRPVEALEWRAIAGVAPITLDEVLIGRIVAFIEAARDLLIDEPPDERDQLRRDLLEAAIGMRKLWADEIAAVPDDPQDTVLVDLGENWVRIEDAATTSALKRVLAGNRPMSNRDLCADDYFALRRGPRVIHWVIEAARGCDVTAADRSGSVLLFSRRECSAIVAG